jgi:hypothetical protein
VVVVIPAECVALVPDEGLQTEASLRNEIHAIYTGTEFHGSLVTLFFQLADGTSFRVEKHATTFAAWNIEPGQQCALAWKPEESFLLARQ